MSRTESKLRVQLTQLAMRKAPPHVRQLRVQVAVPTSVA